MALAYLEHKHKLTINDNHITEILDTIMSDIYFRNSYSDFLPFYFWGAVDGFLQKLNIEADKNGSTYIMMAFLNLYEREIAAKHFGSILATQNKKSGSIFDWIVPIVHKGGEEHFNWISFQHALANKVEFDPKLLSNSFSSYLYESHESYLLDVLESHASRKSD